MKKNMANLDRLIRALVAILVLVLYLMGQISGTAAVILGIVAVVFILTSIFSYCPIYHLLGISTKK